MKEFLADFARWMDQNVGVYGIQPEHLIAIGLIGIAAGLGMLLASEV